MLASGEQVGRHVDDVAAGLDRLDWRAGGDATHDRNGDWPAAVFIGRRTNAAKIALDHAGRESARASRAEAVADRIRQLDHLDGAGPVGQAADEAAFLQGRNQPVDPRF